MRRTATAIALLIVPLLALSGCAPTSPATPPKPKPSSTPLFASEDEALKAATEAYAAYLKVSDQITAEGGVMPERVAEYVTRAELDNELAGYRLFVDKKMHTQGETTFSGAKVERVDSHSVAIYACVDVSKQQLIDSAGVDVTPPNRVSIHAFELNFARGAKTSSLLLDGSDLWSGSGIC